jgi:cell division protein FtsB
MRLRFNIRDLLWLTMVVALMVAWRVDRSYWQKNWNADHEAIIQQVGDLHAELTASQARERRLESQLKKAAVKPTW